VTHAKTKVFLDYDQEELDRAYNQRIWASNADEVIGRYGAESAAVRARLRFMADLAYGGTEDEVLDLFPTARSSAPIHVFIHGGAWRLLSKNESCFAAPTFVEAGAHFVALNFANIPQVRLPGMVAQVRRAIAWLYRNAGNLGGDPDRIYISGHSSGAHLAAAALITDWPSQFGLPADLLKGGLCASGMYDLAPVMLSARGAYLKISALEEDALSPARQLHMVHCPVIVAYGENESPEFRRQALSFARSLDQISRLEDLVVCRGLNHFEVIETLGVPDSPLARAALRQMGLRQQVTRPLA